MSEHFESEASHESISDEDLAKRDAAITRILDGTPLYARPDNSFILHWGKPGTGFGMATFYYSDHENGEMKLYCESEGMSKDFVKEMLCQMIDDSVFED